MEYSKTAVRRITSDSAAEPISILPPEASTSFVPAFGPKLKLKSSRLYLLRQKQIVLQAFIVAKRKKNDFRTDLIFRGAGGCPKKNLCASGWFQSRRGLKTGNSVEFAKKKMTVFLQVAAGQALA
jgi:hypothetical protein